MLKRFHADVAALLLASGRTAACTIRTDNAGEYLGDECVVGAQEIDLFERLLFGGTRLFSLATEVADVLCRSRDDQRDDESDDGGKSEPGLQREHGETTHGVRPAQQD